MLEIPDCRKSKQAALLDGVQCTGQPEVVNTNPQEAGLWNICLHFILIMFPIFYFHYYLSVRGSKEEDELFMIQNAMSLYSFVLFALVGVDRRQDLRNAPPRVNLFFHLMGVTNAQSRGR